MRVTNIAVPFLAGAHPAQRGLTLQVQARIGKWLGHWLEVAELHRLRLQVLHRQAAHQVLPVARAHLHQAPRWELVVTGLFPATGITSTMVQV